MGFTCRCLWKWCIWKEPLRPSIFEQSDQQATATTKTETAFAKVLAHGQKDAEPVVVGLVGGFGSNKTMQLRWLMWHTLTEGLASEGQIPCLPIYVDLGDFRPNQSPLQNSLEVYIIDTLRDLFWPDLTAQKLGELPQGVRLRLLFANLDTMPNADSKMTVEQLIELITQYSPNQDNRFIDYVIAARHDGVQWRALEKVADLHLFVVQPLNYSHMRRILDRLDRMEAIRELKPAVRRERGHRLLEHIFQTDLFDLLSIPWFMFRMIQNARQNKFPKSRASTLMQMIDTPLSRLDKRVGLRDDAATALFTLAWEMQQSGREELSIKECFAIFAQVRGARGYSLEDMFFALIDVDLLVLVNNQTLRFGYLPFQAYCFAEAVMRHSDRQRVLRDIILTLSVPHKLAWWEGSLITVCGMMVEEGAWVSLLELLASLVFGQNLSKGPQVFLVGRCFLECGIDARFDRRISAEKEQPIDTQDIAKISVADQLIRLRDYTVEALNWHTSAKHESSASRRATAIELLSLLAPADRLIEKAVTVYKKIREKRRSATGLRI